MKKTYFIAVFTIYALGSCKSDNEKRHNSTINGFWRLSDDEFVSMVIKADTIYYPDQQEVCSYRQLDKSIIIFDANQYTDTINYEMKSKDTLVFFIADSPQVYVRNAKR